MGRPKETDHETGAIFEALAMRREEDGRRLWALSLTIPGKDDPEPLQSVDPRPDRTGGSTRASRA